MLVAHAGHTLTTIAYFLPVVAFLIWLVGVQIKDRRNRKTRGRDHALPPPVRNGFSDHS